MHDSPPAQLAFDLPNICYIHLLAAKYAFPRSLAPLSDLLASLVHACDGLISASMPALEPPETVQAFTDVLASQSRKLHFLGLLLPETRREAAAERTALAQAPAIAGFLQRVLRTHGERAMLYVRRWDRP